MTIEATKPVVVRVGPDENLLDGEGWISQSQEFDHLDSISMPWADYGGMLSAAKIS